MKSLVHWGVMSIGITFRYKYTDCVTHFDKWIQHTSPARGRREWCEFKPRRENSPAATRSICECGVCLALYVYAVTDDRSAASEPLFPPLSKRSGCCFSPRASHGAPTSTAWGGAGGTSQQVTHLNVLAWKDAEQRKSAMCYFFLPQRQGWPSHHFTTHFSCFSLIPHLLIPAWSHW